MTTMKSSDGSQYVLVLTKEQAELLGTLRHSHVAGGTQLYSALDGLPNVAGANFLLTYDPNNGKPIFGVLAGAPERRPQLAGLLKDEATLRKERNTGWIVQYDRGHLIPFWASLVGNGDEANRVYYSRNEAYRQMRNRAGEAGEPLDRYRVVPDGTKDGPERDRGYYVVEFFHKVKVNRPLGWRRSEISGLSRTFPSARCARRAINTYVSVYDRDRYRVKWRPGGL